jgi:hypothetical protein
MTEIVWTLDNLKNIDGNSVTALGAPKIVETSRGRALEFDGKQDGLLVSAQPLARFETFTVEVIFRPDAEGPKEQRFLHMQESNSENRVLIETRLREDGLWFLDTYIRSGRTDQTLFAEKFTHPVGQWYQAALVFDGREMRHYVNGVEELSSKITFSSLREGRTSIGVRINQVHWFKGAIRTIRFTPRPLQPGEFLKPRRDAAERASLERLDRSGQGSARSGLHGRRRGPVRQGDVNRRHDRRPRNEPPNPAGVPVQFLRVQNWRCRGGPACPPQAGTWAGPYSDAL